MYIFDYIWYSPPPPLNAYSTTTHAHTHFGRIHTFGQNFVLQFYVTEIFNEKYIHALCGRIFILYMISFGWFFYNISKCTLQRTCVRFFFFLVHLNSRFWCGKVRTKSGTHIFRYSFWKRTRAVDSREKDLLARSLLCIYMLHMCDHQLF